MSLHPAHALSYQGHFPGEVAYEKLQCQMRKWIQETFEGLGVGSDTKISSSIGLSKCFIRGLC